MPRVFIKFLFCVLVLLLLGGCSKKQDESQASSPTAMSGRVVFRYQDARSDDRGMGHYIYPVPLQDKKTGIFDMQNFTVRDLGDMVEFQVEFVRPIDRETVDGQFFQKGWAYQIVDIYIDTNRVKGEGLRRALPGRNLEFREEEAWDKVVVLTPSSSRDIDQYFAENSEYRDFYEMRRSIIAPDDVYAGTYTLTARVRKSDVGTPQESWGYQVCVLGFDRDNIGRNGLYNMEVGTFASSKAFGGGTDYEGNTNVIDILSPSKEAQYQVLSQYRSNPGPDQNVLAILPMIYSKGKQNPPQNRSSSMNREPVDILVEPRYLKPVE
ncbi:MAG: hypothetical protein H3C47_09545 [Candidatus Cloacimonetes bacterium]|nr:hypothetical protein [Candidatus Cloacimonadota bacterium]